MTERTIAARYPSKCPDCEGQIKVGDVVRWKKGSKARHLVCGGIDNLDAIRAAAEKDPSVLVELNPYVQRHIGMEYAFCGEGYTYAKAREIVKWEYVCSPLPQRCECGGVMWYRATSSVLKCVDCGELAFDFEYPESA